MNSSGDRNASIAAMKMKSYRQALQVLFGSLPDRTGASFVVIVHLDP
jgi:hypothetical protein